MSKKTIVLADNSYTIRRIVELSFSEESDIELVTFETSTNLREKLLELRPHVILVDIKLPEFSGYDVCRFIQETDTLSHTRVFLLKGGFEPIDEGLLKGLKYVDIITKPFDSNALVSSVKKLLEEVSVQPQTPPSPDHATEEIPSSLPEDFAEVDGVHSVGEDISFSDVKEEIDTDAILPPDDFGRTPAPYADDEVLPSDEVTRAQPEKDTIAPAADESDDNPFAEELPPVPEGEHSITEEELNIKRNIEMQEKELEIGSLTLEEISIKKDIEDRQREEPEEGDVMPDFGDIGAEPQADFSPGPLPEMPEAPAEPPLPPAIEEEPAAVVDSTPRAVEDDELFALDGQNVDESQPLPEPETDPDEGDEALFATPSQPEIPQGDLIQGPAPPELADIQPEPQFTAQEPADVPHLDADPTEAFTTRKLEVSDLEPDVDPREVTDYSNLQVEVAPEPQPPLEMADDMRVGFKEEFDSETTGGTGEEPAFQTPEPESEEPPTEFEEGQDYEVPPIDSSASLNEFQAAQPTPGFEEEPVYEIPRPEPESQSEPRKDAETATPESSEPAASIAGIPQEELLRSVEGKLTNAVKEMLWEIVPPLAEKIIKQEIEALKAEAEKSVD